ncbi:hypothetical protein ACJMK2_005271 [Sinanodonta woodiana]|uniref:RING-type E3 ubiquitin transferase n=1 Tax=Sinanodonta woodiana TaxID=1069815 RepID=A0ABD3VPW4_SINWO
MSRHDGVSCDSCLKGNFRGKRYKCLVCYDYDLCATCYEAGVTTTRHTTDHPVQCILTRTDFDIFYGGEALSPEQPQSFTCPYCSKMGFTEVSLQEHVTSEHMDASNEVVCPICAALPGGDPNHVTEDFSAHLTLEHRAPREFDEPAGVRHVRRIPHPGRGVGGTRTRRATNMHFSSGGASLTGLSPSGRESMDPIAELLSQLSSVRSRAAAAQSVSSQLQQLEMQLQSTRQQLERIPRRPETAKAPSGVPVSSSNQAELSTTGASSGAAGGSSSSSSNTSNSQFLLSRCMDSVISGMDSEAQQERASRSMFVQEVLLSTLTEQLNLLDGGEQVEDFDKLLDKTASAAPSSVKETVPEDIGTLENTNCSGIHPISERNAASAEPLLSKNLAPKPAEKVSGTKQKSTSTALQGVSVPVGGAGGGASRQNMIQFQLQNQGHGQGLHMRSGQGSLAIPNNHPSMPVAVGGGGAAYENENPQPLPGRPGSAGRERERDGRMSHGSAKRTMVKHLPATKATDREPPPH